MAPLGIAAASVSCAQRSLKPATNATTISASLRCSSSTEGGQAEETAGEREGEHDRQGPADQRPEATEEHRVQASRVVFERERALIDALDDADDCPERARDERGDRRRPVDHEPDRCPDADHRRDGRHADEVRDLSLAVRGIVVVLLGKRERLPLSRERFGVLVLVVRDPGIHEAEQVRGAGHHELQADHLTNAREHRLRLHRELVAVMELGRDLRRFLRRPVGLAVEGRDRARPREPALLVRQRDRTLDVRAPVGADDLAVPLLEARARGLILRGRGGRQRALTERLPPVEMHIDELGERRAPRCDGLGRALHGLRWCRGERLRQLGHLDLLTPQSACDEAYAPIRMRTSGACSRHGGRVASSGRTRPCGPPAKDTA